MNMTHGRKAVLALAAAAAVTVPAAPAGAATVVGRFHTLPGGESVGFDISGVAILTRAGDSTFGRVVVIGLEAGDTYAAHLHNQPCSFPGNPGGAHYQNAPGQGSTPPNELWFSSTGNPTDGITANAGGVAIGRGSADWLAGPTARSVIIHFIPAGGSTAGGPKIACADL